MPQYRDDADDDLQRIFGLSSYSRVSVMHGLIAQLENYGITEKGAFKRFLGKFDRYSSNIARPATNDCARLARRLLGRAVGVVLGGGGSRGIAHIGIVQEFMKAGIPIDAVGGTSIGSLVGGLLARDVDCSTTTALIRSISKKLSNPWQYFFDLTLPTSSYLTGHALNRVLWKMFGDRQIEDFWLPFYVLTVDIANTCPVYHRSGYAWRYIRASVSLAGVLPPISDNGKLLLDGGYINNIPVDVMAHSGNAGIIIAVDVSTMFDNDVNDYGDTLSGFWALLQRWFGSHPYIPSYAEIQERLAYVTGESSARELPALSESNPDLIYLRPPVGHLKVFDFSKFESILALGIKFGKEQVEILRSNGCLARILGSRDEDSSIKDQILAPITPIRDLDIWRSPEIAMQDANYQNIDDDYRVLKQAPDIIRFAKDHGLNNNSCSCDNLDLEDRTVLPSFCVSSSERGIPYRRRRRSSL